MRLIDADTLIEAFRENMSVRGGASEELATHIIRILDAAADIDIVRCKECKWYKQSEAFCENGNGLWQAGDECFCSYGERREP